jgi:uncharacterized protein YndB with AHSA1/START domain
MPRPNHVYEIYIRTTPDRLWQALVDPEMTRRYYYGCGFEGTVSAGEPYALRAADGTAAIEGTITEAEPFRRLVTTFHARFGAGTAEEPPSRVTWEITPLGDVCRLSMVHDDLHGSPQTYAATAGGWPVLISSLKSLMETGEPLPSVSAEARGEQATLDDDYHRSGGVETNGLTWKLFEQPDRTQDDDARMIHLAHASAYHWGLVGTAENQARAEWMCSHAYALAGRAEPARYHAERCLAIVEANGITDFDLVYANEAMARSLALSGAVEEAGRYLAAAHATPIADDEDRSIAEADLAAEPWYGLTRS